MCHSSEYPDFTRPFNLTCDARNYAIGCVLSQGPIGKDLPIAYASRTLNKAEINYNTTEKELASIVWGVKTFRPYLFGQQFNIITDHRALVWLFNLKDPGSRLTRWRLKLEEHQYTIHYKPGTNNTNADSLSRINQVVTRSSKASENSKHPDNTDPSKTSEPQNDHSSHQASSSIEIQITENYQEFLQADSSLKKPTKKISEVSGIIFEMDPSISLACCVSADFEMTHGVAVQMRRKFGNLTQLRRLQKKVTEVASLEITDRNIFYLITSKIVLDSERSNEYGLIEDIATVEIKCPFSAKDTLNAIDAVKNKLLQYCKIIDGSIKLKLEHAYYFQIMGQLHISQRQMCYFVIYTPNWMNIELIE
ncbi:hypothetical protein QTP88_029331 [Uroleucon formosanum]